MDFIICSLAVCWSVFRFQYFDVLEVPTYGADARQNVRTFHL